MVNISVPNKFEKKNELARQSLWSDPFFEGFFKPIRLWDNQALEKQFAVPEVDVVETAEKYLVKSDLPGMDEKNIRVEMHGTRLSIEAKREEESHKDRDNYHLKERSRYEYRRSFDFGEEIKPEQVSASYKNGVLEISLAKAQPKQPKVIPVSKA